MRLELKSFAEIAGQAESADPDWILRVKASGKIVRIYETPEFREILARIKRQEVKAVSIPNDIDSAKYEQVYPRFRSSRKQCPEEWTTHRSCSCDGILGRPRLSFRGEEPTLLSPVELWRSAGRDEQELVNLAGDGEQDISRVLLEHGIVSRTFATPEDARDAVSGKANVYLEAWRLETRKGIVCEATKAWSASEADASGGEQFSWKALGELAERVFIEQERLVIRIRMIDLSLKVAYADLLDIEVDPKVLSSVRDGERIPYVIKWVYQLWDSRDEEFGELVRSNGSPHSASASLWFQLFAADIFIPYLIGEIRSALDKER